MVFPFIFQLQDGSEIIVNQSMTKERVLYEFHIALPDGNTDNFQITLPTTDTERNLIAKGYPARTLAIDEFEKRFDA